jgi:fucose permease
MPPDDQALGDFGRARLFWIGGLALFIAATNAAMRAGIAHDLRAQFIDPVDPAGSATLIAGALGVAFLGFAITLGVTSFALDRVGFRAALFFAALAFILGDGVILLAGRFGSGLGPYQAIWAGMFISGLGWGATEGTVNPLVATLFAENRTHRMNMLHAYFPGGIIVGGLASGAADHFGWDWRLVLGLVPVMAAILGVLVLGHRFPPTASAALGMRAKGKAMEFLRRPSFFLWFALMFLTSASELAPGQWVDVALSNVVGMRGILLLVYVSGLMFIGRHFAGPLVRRFSAEGLLCVSTSLAAIGLYLLSIAGSPATALGAATCWGLGVCYLWPTMISVAAERYPRAGTWAVGMMGLAGALSTYFVLPVLGQIYDSAMTEAAGGAALVATLNPRALQAAEIFAAARSFQSVAIIPAFLFVAFAILWFFKALPERPGRAQRAT